MVAKLMQTLLMKKTQWRDDNDLFDVYFEEVTYLGSASNVNRDNMNREKEVGDSEGPSKSYKGKRIAKKNVKVNIMDVEEKNIVYSEEEHTFSDSSNNDGMEMTKTPKHKKFRAETNMEDPTFTVGMLFSTVQQFMKVVREYGIENGHNFI